GSTAGAEIVTVPVTGEDCEDSSGKPVRGALAAGIEAPSSRPRTPTLERRLFVRRHVHSPVRYPATSLRARTNLTERRCWTRVGSHPDRQYVRSYRRTARRSVRSRAAKTAP